MRFSTPVEHKIRGDSAEKGIPGKARGSEPVARIMECALITEGFSPKIFTSVEEIKEPLPEKTVILLLRMRPLSPSRMLRTTESFLCTIAG
ncbi:Uncharacterised protein [Chlamydia trachomatis]|nr:Uncharacterised protein [Chlamydia trachomatis]CRH72884.1 Uncharacterised protein [Chlamydia trachomatis]